MRIRRRDNLPKITDSPYFKVDPVTRELLELRVPASCVKWPHMFRLKLVRDWQPPSHNFRQNEALAYEQFMAVPGYTIHNQAVQFGVIHHHENKKARGWTMCFTTLSSSKKEQRLMLTHPDPIMRSLQVHVFLTDQAIAGFPKLTLIDPPTN